MQLRWNRNPISGLLHDLNESLSRRPITPVTDTPLVPPDSRIQLVKHSGVEIGDEVTCPMANVLRGLSGLWKGIDFLDSEKVDPFIF